MVEKKQGAVMKKVAKIGLAVAVLCLCFVFCASCDRRNFPAPEDLQPFYAAVYTNDMDTVKAYMKKYKHIANFTKTGIDGSKSTTIVAAVLSGSMEMLELMVKQRSDVNIQVDPDNVTALLLALMMKRKDMVEYLLKHKADPFMVDDYKYNVFHYIAGSFRDVETAKLFTRYAPKLINQKDYEGYTPLGLLLFTQYAEHKDNERREAPYDLDILEFFLSNGADASLLFEKPSGVNDSIYLLFYHFIEIRNNDYLRLLLSSLPVKTPNFSKESLLYLNLAIENENTDIIPYLIPQLEDINGTNNFGQTPLHYAAHHESDAGVIRLLIENGADKTMKDNFGNTAYDMYVANNAYPDEAIMDMLR
jgi:ankyrin repeat protein